jgi:branched-chain amino acid transport system permease protein
VEPLISSLLEVLIFGTISGTMYSLLALGFTLIYGIAGVVNLAHGSFFMLGAYSFYSFTQLGINPFLSLLLAFAVTAFIAAIVYRFTIHYVLGDEVGVMVAAVCLAMIFQEILLITASSVQRPIPSFTEGEIMIFNLTIRYTRIIAVMLSVLLFFSLWVLINKSKAGTAMRAVARDREAAMLMGVNTEKLYLLTMAIAAALAAIAGIFVTASASGSAQPWMWMYPLSLSFAIVVLGGLGSIKGSLVGSFIIGLSEQLVIQGLPYGHSIVPIVPFTTMVVVLLLKPKGLFGKRVEMEE